MFVIKYNDRVILGPMVWNARRFKEVILEDAEVTADLPNTNDTNAVIAVNDEIKIYPVVGTENPAYNPRIQFLNGPFWEFTDTQAISSMRVESLPLEAAKNFVKQDAAAERWRRQLLGVEVTLGETTYKFATDLTTKSTFHQYITAGLQSVAWKIDQDTWITLSSTDIQTIFTAITTHVQSAFDWEATKLQEIVNATAETLSDIEITPPQ